MAATARRLSRCVLAIPQNVSRLAKMGPEQVAPWMGGTTCSRTVGLWHSYDCRTSPPVARAGRPIRINSRCAASRRVYVSSPNCLMSRAIRSSSPTGLPGASSTSTSKVPLTGPARMGTPPRRARGVYPGSARAACRSRLSHWHNPCIASRRIPFPFLSGWIASFRQRSPGYLCGSDRVQSPGELLPSLSQPVRRILSSQDEGLPTHTTDHPLLPDDSGRSWADAVCSRLHSSRRSAEEGEQVTDRVAADARSPWSDAR